MNSLIVKSLLLIDGTGKPPIPKGAIRIDPAANRSFCHLLLLEAAISQPRKAKGGCLEEAFKPKRAMAFSQMIF